MTNSTSLSADPIIELFPFNGELWFDTHPAPHIRRAFARLLAKPLTCEAITAMLRKLKARADGGQ